MHCDQMTQHQKNKPLVTSLVESSRPLTTGHNGVLVSANDLINFTTLACMVNHVNFLLTPYYFDNIGSTKYDVMAIGDHETVMMDHHVLHHYSMRLPKHILPVLNNLYNVCLLPLPRYLVTVCLVVMLKMHFRTLHLLNALPLYKLTMHMLIGMNGNIERK